MVRQNGEGVWQLRLQIVGVLSPRIMAAPLPRHLRNALGDNAGRELMTIIDELRADREQSEKKVEELRAHTDRQVTEIRADFRALDARMTARFDRMEENFRSLANDVANVKSDLMKWSFVFWCGAVTAVAALAGVLRP